MEFIYQTNNNSLVSTIVLEQEYVIGFESKRFREKIVDKLDKNVCSLTMDMSNIALISSTGLGMIVSAYISLQRYNIQLKIINVSKEIRELFSIIKIDSLISIE